MAPERLGNHERKGTHNTMMKQLILSGLTAFFTTLTFGQKIIKRPISIGTSVDFHSKVLNENRTLLIHCATTENTLSRAATPTIYVLDGEDHFRYLVGLLHKMGGNSLPKMNIVGIVQNERQKDLDPQQYATFSSYIRDEVIPLSDSVCSPSGAKILIGHSAAGLFAMKVFLHNNEIFQHYLVIDPWLVGQEIPEKIPSVFKSGSIQNKSLFVTMARTFPDSISYNDLKTDRTKTTEMARETQYMITVLSANLNHNQFRNRYFDKESHMSVPNISIYHGIQFFFQGFSKN